ncbi:MAG: hypothetical protein WEB06_10240 [Actinomycetota bacterium]
MRSSRKLIALPMLAATVFVILPTTASAVKACNRTAKSNAAAFDASCAFTYEGNGIRIEGVMLAAGYDKGPGCIVSPCRVPRARLRVYILEHSFFVPCAASGQGLLVCAGMEQAAVLPTVGATVTCYAFAENHADRYRSSVVAFRCSSGKPNL